MAKKLTQIETEIDLATNCLTIRMPLALPPQPSASGKTLVLASTRGNLQTAAMYDGKSITIGVNAYIKK